MGTPAGTRSGRALGIVIGALVVLAAVAAVIASLRPAPRWDVSTPQGTVQAYLSAVVDGDAARAAGFLDPAGSCGASDLDRVGDVRIGRVDLVATHVDGASARVEVAVTAPADDPLGGSVPESHTFRLTRSSAGWRLVGIPWPLYTCGGVR